MTSLQTRARAWILGNRGILVVLGIVAFAKIVFGGLQLEYWYLIPFIAGGTAAAAVVLWLAALTFADKVYGGDSPELSQFWRHPRVLFAVVAMAIVISEFYMHQNRQSRREVAECVRERSWQGSGLRYVDDPVNWCAQYLSEMKSDYADQD